MQKPGIAITEKLLINAGGWQVLKAGREMQKSGRVSEAAYEPPLLTGLVQAGGRAYRSGLRIKSALDVENACTCEQSRRWGTICAHSIAVGLAYLAPAPARIDERPAALIPTPPSGPLFVPAGSENAIPVALHFILPPNFEAAWDRQQIMVVTEAEIGGQRTPLDSLVHDRTYACEAGDLALIACLRQSANGASRSMTMVGRAEFVRMLTAWRGHPRVTFGKGGRADISTEKQCLELAIESRNGGAIQLGTKLPERATMLAAEGKIWLLQDRRFVICAESVPEKYRNLLETPMMLDGDRALQFLAVELPALREIFDFRMPDGMQLPTVVPAEPKFTLNLRGSLQHLGADLFCAYGERPAFAAGSQPADLFVFRDPAAADCILTRDLMAELLAVARLQRSGFGEARNGKGFTLDNQEDIVRFFATEYIALGREWTVALTPQVEKWSGEIERVTPKFEVVGSGTDWFELKFSAATSGGQEFSVLEIQRLLRSGQSQTRLRNGRLAVFDPAGLTDFEEVLRDCSPDQKQPGVYRISRAQAAYVNATALAAGAQSLDLRNGLRRFLTESSEASEAELRRKIGTLAAQLREYQWHGVAWLARLAENRLGGILADEMGLGKTVQMLAFLRAHQGTGPALVVCPTSLVTNWQNEARRFTPELKTLSLDGPDRQSRFGAMASHDLVITSYALLRRDIEELREIEFSTAVLDEAQHIKNPDTQNAQAACSLRATRRFVLTGTPMENSVRDLWSIMNFVAPGYLGILADFRERYEQPLARGNAPDVQRRLARRIQPFLLRRKKREVAKDLPEKIEQVLPCDLTSLQRGAYDGLLREIQGGLGSSKGGHAGQQRMKMLTGLLRLRQVCCDLRLVGLAENGVGASAKLDLLDELLEEAIDGEHRVLLFSQFTSMLALVRQRLDEKKLPYCYLDGSTKNRQDLVDRFQKDATIPVFLLSLKAGGVGLNLSAADTVVHFDPWWNPAVEAQATDRAHRIGQTRVVTSYKLITRGTVEEKILQLQNKKRAAIDAAIDSEEPLMTGLTTEELEELLR